MPEHSAGTGVTMTDPIDLIASLGVVPVIAIDRVSP
jgi:hypothetical protein